MTYHDFQKDMEGIEGKRVNQFALKLALVCLFLGLGLFVLVNNIVNTIVGMVFLILCIFLYITLLGVVSENKDEFEQYEGYVQKWWVSIPLCILMIIGGVLL